MSWPKRFIAMPTTALRVDVTGQSDKGYSARELQEIAATVPAIYERIAGGWGPRDFATAQWSQDLREQRLGETYAKLFRDSPAGAALAASYDGIDLVVDKGNHRIQAARSIGVPVLPVWVSARTEADLDSVELACARRIDREGATAYREAHQVHESARQTQRVALRERELGPEGHERDTHNPELWR